MDSLHLPSPPRPEGPLTVVLRTAAAALANLLVL